jgi:UDP-N-acetylmuramyl pentapeptide synthase
MAAALQTLGASKAARRFAVLGEMLELGESAERAHRELGEKVPAANVEALFLMGTHAALVREAAVQGGLAADRITIAATHDAVIAALRALLRDGDLVLVKGSRGARLEKVVAGIEPT